MPRPSVIDQESNICFTYLHTFADFLLRNYLDDVVEKQLELAYFHELPLMKQFAFMSEKEIFDLSKMGTEQLLTLLSENKIDEQVKRWVTEQLPLVSKHSLVAEDISLLTFIRKQVFLHFLPLYTSDPKVLITTIKEIDHYLLKAESAAFKTFVALSEERFFQQAHFTEKLVDASPSIVFVFDCLNSRLIYSNSKMTDLLGYTNDVLDAMGSNLMINLVHRDDVARVIEDFKGFESAANSEVCSSDFRVKDNRDVYHWMRCRVTVFKRSESGMPTQVLGVTDPIDDEKKNAEILLERDSQLHQTVELLQQSEKFYKQAQEFAHIGNYVWDLATDEIRWTDELFRIYGLEPQSQTITGGFIQQFNYAGDTRIVMDKIGKAIAEQDSFDFYYRIITDQQQLRTLHTRGKAEYNEGGEPLRLVGAVQDVTEYHELVQRLQRSEELYKQAQALSKIGNWRWEIAKNKISWSDELYNIFGFVPLDEISLEKYLSVIHPEDRAVMEFNIRMCIDESRPYEIHHRIIRSTGETRYLHAKGCLEMDPQGKPFAIYGVTQDITERQVLIDELQKSEELYKQAQAISHIGNWTYEVAQNKITWTDELYKIYDMEPQSVHLDWKSFIEFIHADDRDRVYGLLKQVLDDRKPFDIHHKIITRTGIEKVVHIKGEVLVNADGKLATVFGTTQDVTEQKAIEDELRNHRNFIQKIADAAPSVIALYNIRTGNYHFVNESVRKILGYSTQEILEGGLEFMKNLIHPNDLGEVQAQNDAALEQANKKTIAGDKEAIVQFKYRIRHANGHYRWFRTFGTVFDRDDDGNVQSILNVSLDITEKVRAEKIIREQEHFIRHIADASPSVLYLFNVDKNTFEYVNKEITAMLGYTPEEIMALHEEGITALYHPDDKAVFPYRSQSTPGNDNWSGPIFRFEHRMKHKSGEWRWLLTREVVFRKNGGKPVQMLGAALDITDRKEMEKTLNHKTFRLEQSNASLEEFAYVASHDLKEPLRKISSFGERLLATQLNNLSDDGKIYLEKIIDSSRRMQRMVSDLLSVSRISGNKTTEYCSLQTVLDETIQALEFQIERKCAVIKADPLPDAPVIPSQFRQLFQNLLSNSLKFSREEEPLVVEIQHRYISGPEIEMFNLTGNRKYLRIDFCDNGIGFDNLYATKIFAIFQRLHGRSEYDGTGIGLTICKKIVENHEGIIYAEGKPGQGADFVIIIPV